VKSKSIFYFVALSLLVAGILFLNLHADTTPSSGVVPAPEIKTPQAGWVHQIFGPAMSPLWLCSVILVALIFNRTRATKRARVLNTANMHEVANLLGQLQIDKAREAAERSNTLIGHAWARGLKEFALGYTSLSDSLSNSSVVALKRLRKHLWLITTISVIAPMFGLIGTVIGMIITFSTLAETGGVDKSKLAVGLSFALYKTAGGLIIAIPGIISGRYFSARVASYGDEVEDEILNLCHGYSKGLARADQPRPVETVER
jgi:biopolymer transport protein ExbB